MRLSEAILLGSTLNEQGFGALSVSHGCYWIGQEISTIVRTCALGAAAAAMGKLATVENDFAVLEALFPIIEMTGSCPACAGADNYGAIVAHLNDEHRWTRQRIADWVATVEPVDVPATVQTRDRAIEAEAEEKEMACA